MSQVHYSRIFYGGSCSSLSRLFIRDFPVIAFLGFLLVPGLFKSIANAANAANASGQQNETSTQKGLIHQADIVLQTCCAYQSLYDQDEDRCTDVSDEDKIFENEPFPEAITIPTYLVSRVYRNMNWDRKFRLKQHTISCPNGTISINVSLSSPPETLKSARHQLEGTAFTPVNGYLRHDFHVFYPDEYCFNKIDEAEVEIMVCKPDCSEARPCVPKCCDVGEVWDLTKYVAQNGSARCAFAGDMQWMPEIYAEVRDKLPIDFVRAHIIVSHPVNWCEEDATIFSLRTTPFRVLQSEVQYKFDRRKWAPFSQGTYCVDGSFIREDLNDMGHYSGNYDDTIVWDCSPTLETPKTVGTSELYGISMVIAAFFLLITIIVYILLWEKQNVHGWTLLCYFAALFFMYIFYSAVHFTSLTLEMDEISGGGIACYIVAVCAHFFSLASFCYMSCVNFDLYWTFRSLMPTGGKSKGLKKFLAYTVFSLGIPIIIVTVGITLDLLYKDDPYSEIIIPEYGQKTCYLDRKYATLPYVHIPTGLLLACNLVFFTVTLTSIHRINQSTKFATMSSSKNARQRQSMVLFAKLFLVMGLPWIFEVISSSTQEGIIVPLYFKILDMINIFQAVAIFIIFVLKVDVRNSLENKYPRFQRFMLAITIRPDRADSILRRHPRLRFIINPLTRSLTSTRSFSTAKTTLSNGTEGSTSSRANVLGRRGSEAMELTSSSSASNSPSGSLGGKRSVKKKSRTRTTVVEVLELNC